MHRSRITAQNKCGMRKDLCELLQVRPSDEIHGRNFRRRHDIGGDCLIQMSPADEHRHDMLPIEAVTERGKGFRRPALIRPVRADSKGDKHPLVRHALTAQQGLRRHTVTIRDDDGKAHLIHAAADGTRHIQIAFNDVSMCVCTAHGAAHMIRPLTHVRRTNALRCPCRTDDRRRLKEPLQVE